MAVGKRVAVRPRPLALLAHGAGHGLQLLLLDGVIRLLIGLASEHRLFGVLVRTPQHYVDGRAEHAQQCDGGVERGRGAQRKHTRRDLILVCRDEDRNERQPQDARAARGDEHVARLVEAARDLARHVGVAEREQQQDERHDERDGHVALLERLAEVVHGVRALFVVDDRRVVGRWLSQQEPHRVQDALEL